MSPCCDADPPPGFHTQLAANAAGRSRYSSWLGHVLRAEFDPDFSVDVLLAITAAWMPAHRPVRYRRAAKVSIRCKANSAWGLFAEVLLSRRPAGEVRPLVGGTS